MSSRLAQLSVTLMLFAIAGCGDGETIVCEFTESASIVVGGGTAQTGFLSLSDGDDMTVVLGPQGLFMVTPSIRLQGMYPGVGGRTGNGNDPDVVLEVFLQGTLIGGAAKSHMGFTEGGDWAERLGIFMPFTADTSEYVNQTVTIRASVTDACGRSASDELDVVVRQ